MNIILRPWCGILSHRASGGHGAKLKEWWVVCRTDMQRCTSPYAPRTLMRLQLFVMPVPIPTSRTMYIRAILYYLDSALLTQCCCCRSLTGCAMSGDQDGETPLLSVAFSQKPELIQAALDNGADVDILNKVPPAPPPPFSPSHYLLVLLICVLIPLIYCPSHRPVLAVTPTVCCRPGNRLFTPQCSSIT